MDRVERWMTIPAVGPITPLTWALEIGDAKRFPAIKKSHPLLRVVRGREEFRQHGPTHQSARRGLAPASFPLRL